MYWQLPLTLFFFTGLCVMGIPPVGAIFVGGMWLIALYCYYDDQMSNKRRP